jgi:hypothetical protein
MMTCEEDDDCATGTRCAGGYCVEGVVPPAECVGAVQRYELRVGDAFALIGDRTGFLHRRTMDPETGACVDDPAADGRLVGRVPLVAPACEDDDDLATVGPNPCATTVAQTESITPYELDGEACEAGDDEIVTRDADAIRVEVPGFTFHLVDPTTRGDAVCNGDRAGDGPAYPTVYAGFQIHLELTAGTVQMIVGSLEAALPITISAAPDGKLWVVDEGDAGISTNGRLWVVDPANAVDGFGLLIIL